jgi:hypothetical protein
MNMEVRKAAVAGMFYPADPAVLAKTVDELLAAVAPAASPAPKAIIAPHAGYVYSGPIAATAYARLAPLRGVVRHVVVLGPAHRVRVHGLAASSAAYFETPLGLIPADATARSRVLQLPGVQLHDAAHAREHSLEVHLPFLQRVLGDFDLLALAVGDASPEQVAAVLESVWGGHDTLIVISTDLSHYLDYGTARTLDRKTAASIEALRFEDIGHEQACGLGPVSGLMLYARRHGRRLQLLDMRNSGDTAGDKQRVVGYAAFALEAHNPQARFTRREGEHLLGLARQSVQHGLEHGHPLPVNVEEHPLPLREDRACFVTLTRAGQLRGCIGSLTPRRPLVTDVAENAFAAAFHDPRFHALRPEEAADLDYHLSILGLPQPMQFSDEADLLRQLRPGEDGLIISDLGRQATFLPSVWEQLPQPAEFLRHLKQKAGLAAGHWSPAFSVQRYRTQSF